MTFPPRGLHSRSSGRWAAIPSGRRTLPRRRRAFSLVEMLVVVALGSAILGMVGVCLQGMYRAEQRTRQQMTQHAALTQLGLQLRADAHEAVRAERTEPAKPGDTAELVLNVRDGRTITYRADRGQAERTVQRGEQVVHHDAFRLPGVRVAWALETVGEQVLAAAVIGHAPEPGVTAGETVFEERLEARVGLHQKH